MKLLVPCGLFCLFIGFQFGWAKEATFPLSEPHARTILQQSDASADSQLVALLSLSQAMEQRARDSSLALLDQAIALAEKEQLPAYFGTAYRLQANVFFYLGTYEQAIASYHKAARYDQQNGKPIPAAYSFMAIGKCWALQGEIDSMPRYLEVARSLIAPSGSLEDKASLCTNFAEYYGVIGNLAATERYADSALAYSEQSGNLHRLAEGYDQKGLLRMFQQDYEGAIEYFAKAHPLQDSLGFIGLLIGNELNQATAFGRLGMIDPAIQLYYSVIERAEARQEFHYIAIAKGDISVLFQRQGDREKSQLYQQEAIELMASLRPVEKQDFFLTVLETIIEGRDEAGYRALMAQIQKEQLVWGESENLAWRFLEAAAQYQFQQNYPAALAEFQALRLTPDSLIQPFDPIALEVYIGTCYLHLKQARQALTFFQQAENLLKERSFHLAKSKVYLASSQAYHQLGEMKQALIYQQRYEAAIEEEMKAKHAIALQMAETHYHTQEIRRERDLAKENGQLLTQQRQQARTLNWLIGSLLVLAGLFWLFFYRSYQQQRRLRVEVEKERDRNETLLGELNHRVKNNLQNVSNMLRLQEIQTSEGEAKDALRAGHARMEAISLMHKRLYQGGEATHLNLRDFLTHLSDDLIRAYGYRKEQLDIHLQLADLAVDVDQGLAIALIANEWIINAFKYAIPHAPYLRITLEMAGPSTVQLIVADRGPGLAPDFELSRANSYGLQLTNMMAEQLYGTVQVLTGEGTTWQLQFELT